MVLVAVIVGEAVGDSMVAVGVVVGVAVAAGLTITGTDWVVVLFCQTKSVFPSLCSKLAS